MAVPKRLKEVAARADAQGWKYDETSDGHPRLTPPAGLIDPRTNRQAGAITFGKTPSDHRGDANGFAYLRRLGVDVAHKGYTPPKRKS